MTKAIQQSVKFKASPAELFEMYLDSKKHSAATGGLARMSRKLGGKFTAWGNQLSGRNLLILPNKMIVQAWRANHWKASDPDSILVLRFSEAPGGAVVDLVHANVPQHDHRGVSEGWPTYYWKPWKKYIAENSGK
ncbi:MAG TPA: SRPBCC domain-containing protein [Terriglobales bacterium]|jgi:activator of HSP90 ATPase|nr:SRPBCC domain-containing protein [Terriglobales bacterium]